MADRGAMTGNLISGRYELDGRLGSGGMSSVYQATDRVLERTVAVKVLAEHLSDDDKFVARFRREALAVAKLIHPNIVQVFDTGVDAGRHYIVMEYVEGRSGAQILQSNREITPEVAVEIGAQACAGLEYAHRQGIIHRDVKPGNLMVIGGPAPDGDGGPDDMTVKLTDFGIARAGEQTRLTQVGSVVGTAAYLAPEQARGEEATPSSDVYALGVVIYQLLTGRLPYEGSSLAELAIRRESEHPLPPSSYNQAVPETLSDAVLRALHNDPNERYGTARTLAGALRAGLAGRDPGIASEAPTAFVGDATDATRRLPRTREEPRTPVAPAPPRRRPGQRPPRPVIQPAGAPRKGPSTGSVVRWILALILLALVIAVIVALVSLAGSAGDGVDVNDAVEQEVNEQITRLEEFINEHTAQE
ncbi:MAG TPA: protein kinase [Solirubrobacterales bacterium]|nr:protein kinase [Solirubrobacterales bacterium]